VKTKTLKRQAARKPDYAQNALRVVLQSVGSPLVQPIDALIDKWADRRADQEAAIIRHRAADVYPDSPQLQAIYFRSSLAAYREAASS
jgi:hypothetical protein